MKCNCKGRIDCLTKEIKEWAKKNGIDTLSCKTEALKLTEEIGELTAAILRLQTEKVKDAIGDSYIAMTNLAESYGLDIADCIESAYETIKKREGRIIGGNFIKEEDIEGAIHSAD